MSNRAYFIVWVWLIGLLAAGTLISYLPIPHGKAVWLIMGVSVAKALLVSLFYMHLKFERLVPIWAIAVFPFFLIGLAVLLVMTGWIHPV
jgi:caa(3)-type oxidase subunit IV